MTDQKLTFEDVLDELMLEEEAPSYEALVRWQERYPQFRESLAEYFETWAIQEDLPGDIKIDEKKIVEAGVKYAMEVAEKQGRLIRSDQTELLKPFDQMVLAAVHLMHGEGSPVSITEKLSEMLGKEVLLGSVFLSLSQMDERGLISQWTSEAAVEEDGKSKQYFTVTIPGERALAYARETSRAVADALGDFA
jgi:hypothetical protein